MTIGSGHAGPVPGAGDPQPVSMWILDGTGYWHDPAHWDAGVPDADTAARIENGGTAQVELAGNQAGLLTIGGTGNGRLVLLGSDGELHTNGLAVGTGAGVLGTLKLFGMGSVYDARAPGADSILGASGEAELSVQTGATLLTGPATAARNSGAGATISVTGTNSLWQVTDDAGRGDSSLVLARGGSAELSISEGGRVELVGSAGTGSMAYLAEGNAQLWITGSGSRLEAAGDLIVGEQGIATADLINGGKMTTGGGLVAAASPDSSANIMLSGEQTLLDVTGALVLGHAGIADLGVFSSARFTAGSLESANTTDAQARLQLLGPNARGEVAGHTVIGGAGRAILEIWGGAVLETGPADGSQPGSEARVGRDPGSKVEIEIEGAGSSWIHHGTLYLADGGTAAVHVHQGGILSADILQAGGNGHAQLLAESGAQLNTMEAMVGHPASGDATLRGPDTEWTVATLLEIGRTGPGYVLLDDGAALHAGHLVLGRDSSGDGWLWLLDPDCGATIAESLIVGDAGRGTLGIAAGATVKAGFATVAASPGQEAEVYVHGTGSVLEVDHTLTLGGAGIADMWLEDGGELRLPASRGAGNVIMASEAGSDAELWIGPGGGNVDAATIIGGEGQAMIRFNHDVTEGLELQRSDGTSVPLSGSLTVIHSGTGTTRLSGSHDYSGSTAIQAGTLQIDGTLTGGIELFGGTLTGAGELSGGVGATGGTIAPGTGGAGTLHLGGLYMDADVTLVFELATPGVADGTVNDLIVSTDNLTLDGALHVTELDGFAAGTYPLIEYSGKFIDNGLEIAALPPGFDPALASIDTSTPGVVKLVVPGIPELSVDPLTVDFGDWPLDVWSDHVGVTLENTGQAPLVVTALALEGPDADEFWIELDKCTGKTLETGALCPLELRFMAGQPGIRRAALRIASDDPGGPRFLELLGTHDVPFHDDFEREIP